MTTEAINQEQAIDVNESAIVDNAVKAITAKAETLNKKARREALKAATQDIEIKTTATENKREFFSKEATENAIAQKKIEKADKEARAIAASTRSQNVNEKLIHASCYKSNALTKTAIIESAICVAARTIDTFSAQQIEAFISKTYALERVAYKLEATTAKRVIKHVKDCIKAYNSIYYSVDENDIIHLSKACIQKCNDASFKEQVNNIVNLLKK